MCKHCFVPSHDKTKEERREEKYFANYATDNLSEMLKINRDHWSLKPTMKLIGKSVKKESEEHAMKWSARNVCQNIKVSSSGFQVFGFILAEKMCEYLKLKLLSLKLLVAIKLNCPHKRYCRLMKLCKRHLLLNTNIVQQIARLDVT